VIQFLLLTVGVMRQPFRDPCCARARAGAMDGTIRDPLLDKFEKWEKEDKK
jgi:hypothetical protein